MAKKRENGVAWYTTAKTTVTVYFPEGDVCCQWCPWCRSEGDLRRYWCRLTNDMVYLPESGILPSCPLKIVEEEAK